MPSFNLSLNIIIRFYIYIIPKKNQILIFVYLIEKMKVPQVGTKGRRCERVFWKRMSEDKTIVVN